MKGVPIPGLHVVSGFLHWIDNVGTDESVTLDPKYRRELAIALSVTLASLSYLNDQERRPGDGLEDLPGARAAIAKALGSEGQ